MAQALTVNEVAALSGFDESRVRKEVERGLFGSVSPPRFTLSAVVYFRTIALLGVQLGVEDRKKLYSLIAKALRTTKPPSKVKISPVLEVKINRVAEEVGDKLGRFESWKKKLVTDDDILGGEPVFPKSRLAVRQIGGILLRGTPPNEVRDDYPYLTDRDIEFAKLYTSAYPRMGRPRDSKTDSR
jgi:uncharacterized protein (DUF433 family)